MKMLSLLFFHSQSTLYCKKCGQNYNCSPSEHLILYCNKNENICMKLWETLIVRFGNTFYRWFISLSPFDQIVALLSTFDGVIVDEKDNQIL